MELPHPLPVAGPRGGGAPDRVDARVRRGDDAVVARRGLPQLPGRRGGRPGGALVRAGELRPARGAQGPLRPGQRLPLQPERQAERRTRHGLSVASARPGVSSRLMPSRVVDERMRAYYDRRASEYDDFWLGSGRFADRDRPGWDEEVAELVAVLSALPAARVLDVACGTGFLTRHLAGD